MAPEKIPEAEARALRLRHYNAEVFSVIEAAPGLRRLRVVPEGGLRAFEPGQHIKLGRGAWEDAGGLEDAEPVPPGRERDLVTGDLSFSHPVLGPGGDDLAAPDEVKVHEFLVSSQPRSAGDREMRLTPRLMSLKEGDRLHIAAEARGRCTLAPVRPGEDVLFVSTGTGVAPHNAMIWRLLISNHGGRIGCIVSTRRASEQAYSAVHRTLTRRFPSFAYVPLVTREPSGGEEAIRLQGLFASGRLERSLGWAPDPRSSRIYLCGNPEMIFGGAAGREGMLEVLRRLGYAVEPESSRPSNVHFERY